MHGSGPHTHDEKGNAIVIDPITRIEGHMKVEAIVDGGTVKDARCCGTMFRGFERILPGRDPLDAVRLTQRVCGVCPTAHATASAFSLDEALGLADKIPPNARIVRNLILGANFLQSHILHFFTLAALDYVDVTALADYEGTETQLKAVRAFIDRGELGEAYNVEAGNERPNLEVIRLILDELGESEDLIRHVEDRPGHDLSYRMDGAKLRALGWLPRMPWEDGIRLTVRWLAEHEEWMERSIARSRDYFEQWYADR